MFKILNLALKSRLLSASNQPQSLRTFLSQAYYCDEIWEDRLNSPLLKKVNLDLLYHELDQRFQKTRRISPVDVDIFANAVKSDSFIDEMLDLVHKLRLSQDTGNTLNSTSHAVIRNLIKHERTSDLLRVLDDRLNYGVFLDFYTGNILMDKFWKSKDFVAGCMVASQMMLQEDFGHALTANLALLHCYNYLLKPGEWPQAPIPEEPEEEVKIRVKYLRNAFNDGHFDLKEPEKIVAKTLISVTKNKSDSLHSSLRVLGLSLLDKKDLVKKECSGNVKFVKEIMELIPESIRDDLGSLQLKSEDVTSALEKQVVESVAVTSEKDIANQCQIFKDWENERMEKLEEQKKRLLTADRLAEIEKLRQGLKEQEQKLWFFEKEEEIELTIDEGSVVTPVQAVQKKVKVEEEYVPPEATSRRSQ